MRFGVFLRHINPSKQSDLDSTGGADQSIVSIVRLGRAFSPEPRQTKTKMAAQVDVCVTMWLLNRCQENYRPFVLCKMSKGKKCVVFSRLDLEFHSAACSARQRRYSDWLKTSHGRRTLLGRPPIRWLFQTLSVGGVPDGHRAGPQRSACYLVQNPYVGLITWAHRFIKRVSQCGGYCVMAAWRLRCSWSGWIEARPQNALYVYIFGFLQERRP